MSLKIISFKKSKDRSTNIDKDFIGEEIIEKLSEIVVTNYNKEVKKYKDVLQKEKESLNSVKKEFDDVKKKYSEKISENSKIKIINRILNIINKMIDDGKVTSKTYRFIENLLNTIYDKKYDQLKNIEEKLSAYID